MLLNLNTSSIMPFGTLSTADLTAAFSDWTITEEETGYFYVCDERIQMMPGERMTTVQFLCSNGDVTSFYLDKSIEIKPGQPFALFPLDGSCTVRLHTKAPLQKMETQAPKPLPVLHNEFIIRQICTLFFREEGMEFFFSGEQHSAYELVCVTKGQLHVLAGGRDYTLRENEALIIEPDLWHIQYGEKNQGVSFLVTSFFTMAPLPQNMLLRLLPERSETRELVEMMISESQNRASYQHDLLVSLLQNLLIRYARFTKNEGTPKGRTSVVVKNDNIIINQAVQYAAETIFQKTSVQQMARFCGVSTAYLSVLFQAHLGISPGAYMLRARLEESKNMIRNGSGNMAEIAQQLNFSSAPHFSAAFRRQYGITPTAFAKSVK